MCVAWLSKWTHLYKMSVFHSLTSKIKIKGIVMWTSDTMTLSESIITFLIGFSIVFAALIALALFIIISSKVINALVKEEEVVAPKPVANVSNNNANTASAKAVAEKDNQEAENLAVIISAISEELREPVENFTIVSVTEI